MSTYNLSRRKFIGQAGCAALGSTSLLSSILNMRTMDAMLQNTSSVSSCSGHKALVCLFNSGGLDAFNMLIPTTPSEYNTYKSVRGNNALPLTTPPPSNPPHPYPFPIKPINTLNTPGRTFGIHPSMSNIQSLFNSGKAAFIANVGSLVTPITQQEFFDGTVTQPLGLFSHSDQQMHWQTGFAHKRDAVGWSGKMSDLLSSCNTALNLPMNISFSGSNLLQTGSLSTEFTINASNPLSGIWSDSNSTWWYEVMKKNKLTNILDATYVNIFEKTYQNTLKKSRAGLGDINAAITSAPTFSGIFNNTYVSEGGQYLSDAFKVAAQLIAQQASLGLNRQIFFIDYGGWDHHDELLNKQGMMLTDVDTAIGEFQAALASINKTNDVTTFSLSEFSRTITSNGNGTDHAWGSNAFVVGGAVNGQKIYGEYPTSLALNGPLDVGGGVFIPTTAAEEYFAEIALWFGVPPSSLLDLYPNLANFWSISATNKPIGFLNF
jgi:uncharacterized protein (DUF1501 family)